MPISINYVDTLTKSLQDEIKLYNARGCSMKSIAEKTGQPKHLVTKFLMQSHNYIYARNRIGRPLKKEQVLRKEPYSTNERDYGSTGRGKYNWNELSNVERQLANKHEHKQLKQWK